MRLRMLRPRFVEKHPVPIYDTTHAKVVEKHPVPIYNNIFFVR